MQDFKKLRVWQKAHALTLGIDRASKRILARDTNNMPENEFILLVGQTITVRIMLYALLKRVAESESTSLAAGNESDQSPRPPAKQQSRKPKLEAAGRSAQSRRPVVLQLQYPRKRPRHFWRGLLLGAPAVRAPDK